jgi:hypothetical protein
MSQQWQGQHGDLLATNGLHYSFLKVKFLYQIETEFKGLRQQTPTKETEIVLGVI